MAYRDLVATFIDAMQVIPAACAALARHLAAKRSKIATAAVLLPLPTSLARTLAMIGPMSGTVIER